jgi:16S rRNA C967 or C1407 C5-methylase (RsmB/RsmF family)
MERYRDIIPNWETKEVIRQPLPATFRANPLRIDPDELERRLRRRP